MSIGLDEVIPYGSESFLSQEEVRDGIEECETRLLRYPEVKIECSIEAHEGVGDFERIYRDCLKRELERIEEERELDRGGE